VTPIMQDVRLAHALADEARAVALRHFREPLAVDRKADDTPVTVADREIERRLRAGLAEARPLDGVLGEEEGPTRPDARRLWVIDPIDGTKAFITGSPLFGTLIALVEDGRPTLGVVEVPALGERFVGAGGATTLAGRPCRTRACHALGDAALSTIGPETLARVPEIDRALSDAVALRRYGGDCYAYCQLALGFLDLVVETGMAPHDFLALVPVVTGAGGVISDWRGERLTVGSAGEVVAAGSPEVHEQALALLAPVSSPAAPRAR
jgi:myo-inositol-1(or 4)-monophosphatase